MNESDWPTLLLSGMTSAIVSGALTWYIAGRQYDKQQKRALLARLLANRAVPLPAAFFQALNEIPAVFADNKRVLRAWRTMLTEGQGVESANLITVIRATADAAGADIAGISDEELSSAIRTWARKSTPTVNKGWTRSGGRRISRGGFFTKRKTVEWIHEGKYAAEVPVELIEQDEEGGGSLYLSVDDATKPVKVRGALHKGDVQTAANRPRVRAAALAG